MTAVLLCWTQNLNLEEVEVAVEEGQVDQVEVEELLLGWAVSLQEGCQN